MISLDATFCSAIKSMFDQFEKQIFEIFPFFILKNVCFRINSNYTIRAGTDTAKY